MTIPTGGGSAPYPGLFGIQVPTYPGPPSFESNPLFQYNPRFDGLYAHGLTPSPYLNSLFEDVNTMETQIMSAHGVGYPPANVYGVYG